MKYDDASHFNRDQLKGPSNLVYQQNAEAVSSERSSSQYKDLGASLLLIDDEGEDILSGRKIEEGKLKNNKEIPYIEEME